MIPAGTRCGDEHNKSSWILHISIFGLKRTMEISCLGRPESLSPGCPLLEVSLRTLLTLCLLAAAVAAPDPMLSPSSAQDVTLPSCKVKAPFCKAWRARSQIRILCKNKKYVGIILSVIIFAPRHVCSESMSYIITSDNFLRKENLSAFCIEGKCRNLSFTVKATENDFSNDFSKFIKIGTHLENETIYGSFLISYQ